eukprot:9016719-Karenia_brevis.AAC.1
MRGKKADSTAGGIWNTKGLYRKNSGSKLLKIKSRWGYGISVGVNRRSNELLTSTVVKKSRSLR